MLGTVISSVDTAMNKSEACPLQHKFNREKLTIIKYEVPQEVASAMGIKAKLCKVTAAVVACF